MSKNIDDILREIAKSNKEIHNIDNHLTKDIIDIKKTVKNIENKIKILESKINQALELLNTFTVLLSDLEEDIDVDEVEENNEWTPYDAIEDYYNDHEDEDGEEEEN